MSRYSDTASNDWASVLQWPRRAGHFHVWRSLPEVCVLASAGGSFVHARDLAHLAAISALGRVSNRFCAECPPAAAPPGLLAKLSQLVSQHRRPNCRALLGSHGTLRPKCILRIATLLVHHAINHATRERRRSTKTRAKPKGGPHGSLDDAAA
jgi:hypothetical protein